MKQFYAKISALLVVLLFVGASALAQSARPIVAIQNIKDACNGENNGSFEVLVRDGQAPFTLFIFGPGILINNAPIVIGEPYLVSGAHPNSYYTVVVADKDPDATTLSAEIGSTSGVMIDAFTLTPNSCASAGDGSIDLEVSGGSGQYRFSLDGGNTFVANPISGLAHGSYEVMVFDANTNCFASGTYTIENTLALTVASPQSLCRSDESYELTQAVTPSVAGGQYTFSGPGVSGSSFDPALASAGANTINIVYTLNGCTATGTLVVNVNQAPTLNATITNIACFGGNTGAIDLSISGGTAPYTIEWEGGLASEDRTGLTAGTYTVTVTDQNNCPVQQSFTITQADPIAIEAVVSDVRCKGEGNGAIDITVTGGAGGYTYSWDWGGRSSQDLSGLQPGDYSVVVTDSQGCTANQSFTIAEPEELTASVAISNPVSCFGATDAALSLMVAGGTAPYTYSWIPGGAATQNLSGIGAGTYTATVTDANGCRTTATIVVDEPAVLALNYTVINATTCGGSQGSIDLSVSGGTGEYTYEWDNGQSSQDISNLTAGTYTIIVSDESGCTETASVVVGEPAGISAVEGALSQVSCNGAGDGAIVLTVTGGTGTYTYSWSNGQTTKDISGLAPDTYTVTVTDTNECSFERSFIISEPAVLSLNAQTTDILCAGAATGAINLTVSGGTAPYSFSWTNTTASTQNISGLTAGTYEVTVVDANGCRISAAYTLTQPDALSASAVATAASCFGDSNGSVTLSVSGGTGAYTYSWSNGATTQNLVNVAAGTYGVTITDASNCTTTASATVGQPARLVAATSGTSTICEGASNGWVRVNPTGGTGPYTVLWSTGATSSRVNNLPAGTYTVRVTDANGCTADGSFTITEPSMLVELGEDITACAGTSITLQSGHNAGNNNILWSTGATTPNINVTTSGTYWVRVTDRNTSCEGYDEIVVSFIPNEPVTVTVAPSATITCHTTSVEMVATPTNPGTNPTYTWTVNGVPTGGNTITLQLPTFADGDIVAVQLTPSHSCSSGPASGSYTLRTMPGLTLTAAVTNSSCFGEADGAIDLSVSGGTGEYTYSWSTTAATQDIADLAAGEYTVTVSDQAGCSATATYTIEQPAVLSAQAAGTNVTSCAGNNGAVVLTVTGGTEGYSYLWNNGATSKDLSDLTAGTYRVTITDANGCTTTAEATITQPDPISLTATASHVTRCNGTDGSIALAVTGGTGPYNYLWSNGATTANVTELAADTYSVTVTDANGCTAVAEVVVNEPDGITSLTAVATDAACNGAATGALVLTVNGGTAPYQYAWSNGATTKDIDALVAGSYTVTVTDANGCSLEAEFSIGQPNTLAVEATVRATSACGAADGSIDLTVSGGTAPYTYSWNEGAFTSEDLTNLTAGNYTIYIEDAAGCSATATYAVSDGNGPAITATVQDASCFGTATGSISLAISGGTGPYAIEWGGGETSQDISELLAGTYTVRVTDANGCMANASLEVGEPSQINITTAVTDLTSCTSNNGAIALTVSGGTGSYTYSWNTGATDSDLTDLAAGEYTVTVTDASGCSATATATIAQPVVLSLTTAITNTTSCESSDGAVALTVSGGTAPYTYSWNEGAFTTEDISDLPAGTYTVTVTDAGGCTATATASVTAPSGISSLTADIRQLRCDGAEDGAIVLMVTGGTAPFSYSWSTGATSQNINDLAAGEYTVTVTDASGCTARETFTITAPAPLQLAADAGLTSACGAEDGSIQVEVSGGTAPYAYSWSTGETGESISGLAAGAYSLTVTDAAGCSITRTYSISDPSAPEVTANVQSIDCGGNSSGAIDISVSGGTAPYTYLWNTGATSEDIADLPAGNYDVTVTDANGCRSNMRFTIQQSSDLSVSADAVAARCYGAASGSIALTVSGGTGPYTYLWNTGATTATLSDLAAGDYSVTVTDASGCTMVANATVTQPEELQVGVSGTSSLCAGAADGTLTAAVTGGTATYTYLWSTGAATETVSNLAAGTYTVDITDANGCSISATHTISEERLQVNLGGNRALCAPASLTLSSGYDVASHSIRWSTGSEEAEITVTATGTYSVTVTNLATGCTGTDEVLIEIENEFAPSVAISPVDEITCNSAEVVLEAVPTYGGDAPTYQWWNAVTGEMIGTGSRLAVPSFNNGDSFMVEMTSSLECATTATVSEMYQILLPNVEAPVFASTEERVCIGSTMPTIRATNGGTLRWYRERVDPSMLVFEGTDFTPTDSEEGTYTYYVTEITRLCGEGPATLFTLTLYEGECDPVSCDVTPTVAISIMPGSEICAEITSVQLEANAEQVGTNPQFAWFFNDETTPFSTEASAAYTAADGFAEGDRFRVEVTITDEAFICNGQTTISAIQSIRLVDEMPLAVSLSSSAPNGTCPGTPITFTASAPAAGADPTYTFFTMGAGNSMREEQSGRSNSFVLSAPQNGQQVWVEVTVNDPEVSCVAPQASSQPVAVQVLTSEECVGNPIACEQFTIEVTELVRPSCGLDNGKLVYYITSRTSPFRLSYSLGDRIVQEQVNSPYILTVDNIPALQNLQVILGEGANRCVFNYLLEQAPRLDITFEKLPDGDIVCHGENTGKARLTVNGGNAPYQYLLEGASEWQTLNGNTIVFTTLPAGINNILVRNNADDTCPDVASIEIFNLNERVEIEYSVTQQANCNDNIGVFRLMTISGGSAGNGYRVKLASEESWRDFIPGMEFNGLARGRHVLNITDGVCQVNRSIVIPSPGLIALSEESGVMNFTCERPELRNGIFLKIDGSITEVGGPYVADFFMMNSQGQYQLIASEELFNGNGELYKFQLERGSYRVEVRNINREGCPEVAEYVIEGSEIPVPITYEAEAQSIYCEDATGGVLITNLKGAAGLRYEVEIRDADGNIALSKTITTFEYATQESFAIMGLPEGLYRMVIRQDQGLCNTIESSRPFDLLIRETDKKLAVSILGKTVSFPERATGSLSLRVTNGSGTAPYTASLVWLDRVEDQEDWVFASYDDAIPYNATTGRYDLTYHNLPPGVYELTVVDAKGCTVVIRETIMYDTNLFIPNIITPNGDGANEVFYIRNKPARTHLTITNRWGKVVYETLDYLNDWDGDSLPEGIYFYSIKAPQVENGIHKGWLEIRRGARPN